jgi:phosphopantetheine--protein transferase-like protein
MAILCGTDIVHIPKVEGMLGNDAVLRRFFHASELSRSDAEHLAGILAAKEAFFKALGVLPRFQEVELLYEPSGRPKLVVSPEFKKFDSCDVSISHEKDYAIAMVVLERWQKQ